MLLSVSTCSTECVCLVPKGCDPGLGLCTKLSFQSAPFSLWVGLGAGFHAENFGVGGAGMSIACKFYKASKFFY